MLKQALPALLLLGLLDGTRPALARGLVPLCTATGLHWTDPQAPGEEQRERHPPPCAHGWCFGRKAKPGRG